MGLNHNPGGNVRLTVGGVEVNVEAPLPVEIPSEYYVARQETPVCRWANDQTGLNVLTVLTLGPAGIQPGIYYNLEEGKILFVTTLCYELTTLSDWMRVEYGYTSGPNATGTFRPLSPVFRVQTGAAAMGFVPPYKILTPPLRVAYADNVRSFTARVQTNAANTRVMVAWHGWVEDE